MHSSNEQIFASKKRSGETKRRNTRRSLVSAAALSFYTNGYQGSNITKIGDSAKSAATLFNHFETKASLGLAVIEATFPEIIKSQKRNKELSVLEVMHSLGSTLLLYEAIGLALYEERARTSYTNAELLPVVFEKVTASVTTEQSINQIRLDLSAAHIADILITQTTATSIGQPFIQTYDSARVAILLDNVPSKASF